jgi:N-acetyl-gamma-glutamyl-phosphate/LysW-gamma-L-alpha-aminoadipyl-6-phosphate reductase
MRALGSSNSPRAVEEQPGLVSVSVVGASGYTGGELVRLLLAHPRVRLCQITSERYAGKYAHAVHPNLRPAFGSPALRFVAPDALEPCDVLFLAQPHGTSMHQIERYRALTPRIIDLSADFRLRDPEAYVRWYGHPHAAPALLSSAVYGIPELHRNELPDASLVSGAGCLATAAILGLAPLARAGVLDREAPLLVEAKVGSSAAGAEITLASHHAERSGAVRSFQPTAHRHSAEILQELQWPETAEASPGGRARSKPGCVPGLYFSATAVELVRGVLVTAHAFLRDRLSERDVWAIYRAAYGAEPFVRTVKERTGVYRYPEPKLLAGTNFCDVGFEVEPGTRRVVVMAALDNLMKGAAGNALQALNAMMGWDETLGLAFRGLHPL